MGELYQKKQSRFSMGAGRKGYSMKQIKHGNLIINVEMETRDKHDELSEAIHISLKTSHGKDVGQAVVKKNPKDYFVEVELDDTEYSFDLTESEIESLHRVERNVRSKEVAYELAWLSIEDEFIGMGLGRVLLNIALEEVNKIEEKKNAFMYLTACAFIRIGGGLDCQGLEKFYMSAGFEPYQEFIGNIMMIMEDLDDMKIGEINYIDNSISLVEEVRKSNAQKRELNRIKRAESEGVQYAKVS